MQPLFDVGPLTACIHGYHGVLIQTCSNFIRLWCRVVSGHMSMALVYSSSVQCSHENAS